MASICLSKLALITFVRGLTVATLDRRIARGLEIFISTWAIVGAFGMAFACQLPYPWDYLDRKCFNRVNIPPIVRSFSLTATECMVELSWGDQYCFGCRYFCSVNYSRYPDSDQYPKEGYPGECFRIQTAVSFSQFKSCNVVDAIIPSVIAAIISQLVFLNRTAHSSDSTFDTAPATIALELTQALSIITACAPQLKPFLDSLQSTGMRLNGITRGTNSYKTSASGSYARTGRSAGGNAQKTQPIPLLDGNHTMVLTANRDCDVDSQSSQAQIIRETRTWTVTEAPRSLGVESL